MAIILIIDRVLWIEEKILTKCNKNVTLNTTRGINNSLENKWSAN